MRGVRVILVALCVAIALPAAGQFKDVRRAVDREVGGHRLWIPFAGLARLYVKSAHPEGIHDFQFAVYDGARGAGRGSIEKIFETHLGPEWQPFVKASSHREGEEVLIYAREGDGGRTIDLMIFAGDAEETVLMMTTLDVERFVDGLDDPDGFAAR